MKEIWSDESSRKVTVEKQETPLGLKFRMTAHSGNQVLAQGLFKAGSIAALRSLNTELDGGARNMPLKAAMTRLEIMHGVLGIVKDSVKRKAVEEALGG